MAALNQPLADLAADLTGPVAAGGPAACGPASAGG